MKDKVIEWIIFAILLLVITHMTYGLDELSTFGWALMDVIFAVFATMASTNFRVRINGEKVNLVREAGNGPGRNRHEQDQGSGKRGSPPQRVDGCAKQVSLSWFRRLGIFFL